MEALHSGNITDKSDIYPFGLLLWEMLTLSVPHVDLILGINIIFLNYPNFSKLGILILYIF